MIIGTFGSTGSVVLSNWHDNVVDILNQIPNNNTNEIVAKNIRDSVFTLWSMIKEVEVTAASGASAAQTYTNLNETPLPIGGIPDGSTFSNMNMQQMWDLLLYPYIPPSCELSLPISNKQYGANPSPSVTLDWSVTMGTLQIDEIWVTGVAQSGTSGTQTTTGSHPLTPTASFTNTFTMSVSDGGTAGTYSTTLKWMNSVYAGSIDLSYFTQSNNVMDIPALAISNHISSTFSNIINPIKYLSDTKTIGYTGINGGGNFLFFAWPSNVLGATSASFEVNNSTNTAFTMISDTFSHVNSDGFTASYTIYVSNTAQYSPLNIKIS